MDIPDQVIRRTAFISTVAMAALLGGCAAAKFEAPKLSVVSAKVLSADLFSQRVLVHMHVANPNDRELPIKSITYRIEVPEGELANGESTAPFVVPALGEAEFDVQVTANLAPTLLRFAHGGKNSSKLDYHLVGKVALSSGFVRSIPFDEHGSFDLK